MPRLTRLRFVNIGYPDARMDDLILNLSDPERNPLDSTLWLRNGGGKSSLLSLFYSLLSPHRQSFLGAKASDGERKLEDYVLHDDRAVVIAEWQTDTEPKAWRLTGAFYEWQHGETQQLRRTFFASNVLKPELTLERLPLHAQDGQRLTLHGFKQAWHILDQAYPHAELHETENQREWAKILEGLRIDVELYLYQLRMNAREGNADELFRFKESDEFVNFFLELVMRPQAGINLLRNLNEHRTALRFRRTELLPSLGLIEALRTDLQPMLEVGTQRHVKRGQLAELQFRTGQLQTHLETRVATLQSEVSSIQESERQAFENLERWRHEKSHQQQRLVSLERHRLLRRTVRFETAREDHDQQHRDTIWQRLLLELAIPLADLQRGENEVRDLEALLKRQQGKLAPTWKKVQAAAAAFTAALLARADEQQQRALEKMAMAQVEHENAERARANADRAKREFGEITVRIEHLERELAQANQSRDRLRREGVLFGDEDVQQAQNRWLFEQTTCETDTALNATSLKDAIDQRDSLEMQLLQARDDLNKANHEHQESQRIFELGLQSRQALLDNPILVQALELSFADAGVLSAFSRTQLQSKRLQADLRFRDQTALITEQEVTLEYLRAHGVLPPARDVRTVVDHLMQQGVSCSSGWAYIAENVRPEDVRAVIAQQPELAQGVLVLAKHFAKARDALESFQAPLDAPVVVARRESLQRQANGSEVTERIVIGPSSDAMFNHRAAAQDILERESRVLLARMESRDLERDADALRQVADQLAAFLEAYPEGWFQAREYELLTAAKHERASRDRVGELQGNLASTLERVQQFEQRRESLHQAVARIGIAQSKLEAYIERYEIAADERERQLQESQQLLQDLQAVCMLEDRTNRDAATRARAWIAEAERFANSAKSDQGKAKNVQYLQDHTTTAMAGDVDALEVTHRRLCDLIDEKTGGDSLREKLNQALKTRDDMGAKFERTLSDARSENKSLTVDAVQELLSSRKDWSGFNEALRLARTLEGSARDAFTEAKTNLANAQSELERHRKTNPGQILPVHPDEALLAETELETLEAQARETMKHAQENEQTQQRLYTGLTDQRINLERKRDHLSSKKLTVTDTLEAYQDLFAIALPASLVPFIAPNDDQLDAQINDCKKLLQRLRDEHAGLSEKRDRIHRDLQSEIGGAHFDFAVTLRKWLPEQLELGTQELLDELELRVIQIHKDLEEGEQSRQTLITETLAVAETGTQLLKGLSTHSKLPATAGTLAGERFLNLTIHSSSTPSERREQIGTLLDDLIDHNESPKAAELMQRAVRKIAPKITVEALFPDMYAAPRYLPITVFATKSGGEKLTNAVLLYCTLAQQRARSREQDLRNSSVLLLDNPQGAASREQFLTLQRETARAMNVQLIFATGVNDPGAIRVLPNVVRLRNERRNAKQQRLIEVTQWIRPEEDTN
jgi:hypothetical protein